MSEIWILGSGDDWVAAVALALAHFLWQGLLVGLIAIVLNRCMRSTSASA